MRHRYDPACPDCVPVVVDMETGEPFARDSPTMVAVMRVWNAATFAERQAYMDFENSRPDEWAPLMGRIRAAVEAVARSCN